MFRPIAKEATADFITVLKCCYVLENVIFQTTSAMASDLSIIRSGSSFLMLSG